MAPILPLSNGGTNQGTWTPSTIVEVKSDGSKLESGPLVAGFATTVGVQGEAYTYAADTGAADAYAVALIPAVGAYAAGLQVTFKAVNANTGASTLAVNGLAPQAIKKSVSLALVASDILAGQIITVIYDGTNFQKVTV